MKTTMNDVTGNNVVRYEYFK